MTWKFKSAEIFDGNLIVEFTILDPSAAVFSTGRAEVPPGVTFEELTEKINKRVEQLSQNAALEPLRQLILAAIPTA